jgi:hypothetical protein
MFFSVEDIVAYTPFGFFGPTATVSPQDVPSFTLPLSPAAATCPLLADAFVAVVAEADELELELDEPQAAVIIATAAHSASAASGLDRQRRDRDLIACVCVIS